MDEMPNFTRFTPDQQCSPHIARSNGRELSEDAVFQRIPRTLTPPQTPRSFAIEDEFSLTTKLRPWRKPLDKPKRPLSAYNLFFQLARQRLISDTPSNLPFTAKDVELISMKHKQKKEKRRHRKTHGKISFADLARSIASQWKELSDDDKVIFEERAEMEKCRYKQELSEWSAKQEPSAERKAAMLRKVSLEQGSSFSMATTAEQLSSTSRAPDHGNPIRSTNSFGISSPPQRPPYDLDMYTASHEAAIQEEVSLNALIAHQGQSLARYQAMMEQQMDQHASMHPMSSMRGLPSSNYNDRLHRNSYRPAHPNPMNGTFGSGGKTNLHYNDGTPDCYDMAQQCYSMAHRQQQQNGRHYSKQQRHGPPPSDMHSGIPSNTTEVMLARARTTMQPHMAPSSSDSYWTMDRSTEHRRLIPPNSAGYRHSRSAQDESTLMLDPHQGLSSPLLGTADEHLDPFANVYI